MDEFSLTRKLREMGIATTFRQRCELLDLFMEECHTAWNAGYEEASEETAAQLREWSYGEG